MFFFHLSDQTSLYRWSMLKHELSIEFKDIHAWFYVLLFWATGNYKISKGCYRKQVSSIHRGAHNTESQKRSCGISPMT